MTSYNHTLPPLLELELNRTLHRYRRLRMLRATLKFFILPLPLIAVVVLACWWWPIHLAVVGMLIALVVAAAGTWAFWPVFTRPISLRDVASFIDRQHPDLQDRVLSAVVLAERGETAASAWMLENFLTEAQQRVKGVPLDDFMRPWEFRFLAGCVALCGMLSIVGGLGAAWKFGVVRDTQDAGRRLAKLSLEVKPGNAEIQPGDNLIVWVSASDTASAKYIYWQQGGAEQRAILQPSTTPEVSYYTFTALQEDVHYQVRVGGEESERFEIRVKRPPGVESIEARYVYPEYLGLAPSSVPFSGEINGVEGTHVTLHVEVNKSLESLRMVRDGADEIALTPVGEKQWEGRFDLAQSGSYHLALLDREGQENPDPETYKISVTPDNPPVVRVKFPRGDAKVLALEEVPFAFEVEDDFGIDGYGVEYGLAGKEPVRLALNKPGETVQEVAAEHLMALEELGLSDGDLITWSIWATDKKPGRADYETAGDPYFLEVRPYTLRYREQVSQGGGGGAGGGGDAALDQKKIIISLTNLRKSAKALKEEDFNGHKEKIGSSQSLLREQLAEGLQKASPDDQRKGGEAIQAMDEVLSALGGAALPAPEAALGEGVDAAERAWQAMLKLEPELREVARQEGGGGGGAGAGQQELDALEMGQRKGYVEEASTSAEASKENEAIRKGLEDLARRQELLNEDLGKLISEAEQAKAAEEKKRQLERLQEEQRRQMERLDQLRNQVASSAMERGQREAARGTLEQARESMERSLESARGESLQEARASGSRAAQNLSDAESALEQVTRSGARERFAALEEDLKALGERQASVQKETSALKEAQAAPGVEGHDAWAERVETLKSEKKALAAETRKALEGAGGLSDQLRPNQELLSRKLGDWVRRTSKTGVVEDMEESLPLVEYGVWDAAERQEAQVKRKIDDAAKNLASLRGFLPGASEDSMERALEMLTGLEGKGEDAPGEGKAGAGLADASAPDEPGQGTPGQSGEGQESAGNGQTPGNTETAQGAPEGEVASAGGNSGGGEGGGPDGVPSMGGFFDGEAREWRPVLRDAASLLPQESTTRRSLEQVEMELGRLQREYDERKELPEVQEFEQVVRRPLMDTIATLETLVRAKATGEATVLEDEGAIPEQYVDRVAEYFRLLAEKPVEP